MLPSPGGVIVSAVASGSIVAKTNRHRRLTFGSLVLATVGLAMLTQLGQAGVRHRRAWAGLRDAVSVPRRPLW